MPYAPEHKRRTRARIAERARQLFNRHGFNEVSIDQIMAAAGLMRGGFYNHFETKEELYAEILVAFAQGRERLGRVIIEHNPEIAKQFITNCVSRQHRSEGALASRPIPRSINTADRRPCSDQQPTRQSALRLWHVQAQVDERPSARGL